MVGKVKPRTRTMPTRETNSRMTVLVAVVPIVILVLPLAYSLVSNWSDAQDLAQDVLF